MEQYNKELAADADPIRLKRALFKRDVDIHGAISELEILVEQGSSFAMIALGMIHVYGGHGAPIDEARGEALLSRSVQLGSIEGAYRLACFLDAKKRHKEAFVLYHDLAAKKFSPALYRLAWAYDEGRWVERDSGKARELFFEAYRKKHLLAQQKLSYDLRHSSKLLDKLYGFYLLVTLFVPRGLKYRRPLSDRLRD